MLANFLFPEYLTEDSHLFPSFETSIRFSALCEIEETWLKLSFPLIKRQKDSCFTIKVTGYSLVIRS